MLKDGSKSAVLAENSGGQLRRGQRDYIFLELTRSLCPECLALIDAKVVLRQDGRVTMIKRCPEHGEFEVLLSTDAGYYCNTLAYNKPGSIPCAFNSEIKDGCPNDCGLCPDHEQHTCVALMEITGRCNMNCPVCYADSGAGGDISLDQARAMLEMYIRAEGNPEVIQISGGEPTLHPGLDDILELSTAYGVKVILLNTNGIRLAEDEDFVKSLVRFDPSLEIYLQYDSLTEQVGKVLRGRDMREIHLKALDNLEKHGIYANLVATLMKGINDHEIGQIINEAINRPFVTGVVLQLMTGVGRASANKLMMERLTVPDVIRMVEEQTGGDFRADDFVPLPCSYPTCCSLTYAFVLGGKKKKVNPITRYIDVGKYLDYFKNTLCIDARDLLNEAIFHSVDRLWSASASLRLADVLRDFGRCCGVKFKPGGDLDPYRQIPGKPFKLVIKPFMDAYNYDLKRVKKCCIHVLTPGGKMVPFCNYNILHRKK